MILMFNIGDTNENEGKYIGCYADDAHRDLSHGPMKYGYTQATCNVACQAYSYFALQNNGWCCCGNSYSTKPQYSKRPDSECGGARGRGKGWRNSVYSTYPGTEGEFKNILYVAFVK